MMRCLLSVIALSLVLSAGPIEAGGFSSVNLDVTAKNHRSNCDIPEWFIGVNNTDNAIHYRVRIEAEVKASVGPEPLCVEILDEIVEVAPGTCRCLSRPFYNGPGQPCDDPCCVNNEGNCNKCTDIREATITLLAKSYDGVQWQVLQTPEVVASIRGGRPSGNITLSSFCDTGSLDLTCGGTPCN